MNNYNQNGEDLSSLLDQINDVESPERRTAFTGNVQ